MDKDKKTMININVGTVGHIDNFQEIVVLESANAKNMTVLLKLLENQKKEYEKEHSFVKASKINMAIKLIKDC